MKKISIVSNGHYTGTEVRIDGVLVPVQRLRFLIDANRDDPFGRLVLVTNNPSVEMQFLAVQVGDGGGCPGGDLAAKDAWTAALEADNRRLRLLITKMLASATGAGFDPAMINAATSDGEQPHYVIDGRTGPVTVTPVCRACGQEIANGSTTGDR